MPSPSIRAWFLAGATACVLALVGFFALTRSGSEPGRRVVGPVGIQPAARVEATDVPGLGRAHDLPELGREPPVRVVVSPPPVARPRKPVPPAESRQRSTRGLRCLRPLPHRPLLHHRRRCRLRALRSRNLRRRLPRARTRSAPVVLRRLWMKVPTIADRDFLGGRDSDVAQPPASASGTRGPRRPRARADSAAAPAGAHPQRGSRVRSPRHPDLAPTSLRCCDRGGCPQQSRARRPRTEAGPHPCLSAPGRDPRRSGHPPRASPPRLQPRRSRFAVSLAGGAGRVADRRAEQRLLP